MVADSERAAERLLDQVEAAIDRLRQYPLAGAPRENLTPGLRSVRAAPFRYLIFYRVTGEDIVLIRLLHGVRNLSQQNDWT